MRKGGDKGSVFLGEVEFERLKPAFTNSRFNATDGVALLMVPADDKMKVSDDGETIYVCMLAKKDALRLAIDIQDYYAGRIDITEDYLLRQPVVKQAR